MKQLLFAAMAALSLAACRQNDNFADSESSFGMEATSADYTAECSKPVQTVSGNVGSSTAPISWTNDKIWEIDGIVNVPSGVTLTIQEGTFIKAKPKTDGSATGVLVVQKGGKLNAIGTATQPIVFTSYKLLDCNASTIAAPKDFGGVVILGDAPTNMPVTTTIEGLSGSQYSYGGTNEFHNGGTLKYVRIEFAGYELPTEIGAGNEINGLTLGGVGKDTTLENIQVSYGADDAFEFFGGNVKASNLIAFAQDDDGFDFDHGYTGTITCALALADFNSSHSLSGSSPDSNGIELDGKNTGYNGMDLTHPTINNLTIVGTKAAAKGVLYENGIHVRKAGRLTLNDAVITGYPVGVLVESPSTVADLLFTNVKVHGFTYATAEKITAGTNPVTVPGVVSAIVSDPAQTFGMTQPFFNEGAWNVSPRNCGNFKGSWTKYTF